MKALDIVLTKPGNNLQFFGDFSDQPKSWRGSSDSVSFDWVGIQAKLLALGNPCHVVRINGQVGVTHAGQILEGSGQAELLLTAPPLSIQQLGDRSFQASHGVRCGYAAGAMAGGIASEELVIALGKEKILSSFGAGGLSLSRLEAAIRRIQQALPQGPYAFNLIHSPSEPATERGAVDLYLKYGVRTIEASAFLDLTPNLVYYRAAGLSLNAAQQIDIKNKIIAKVSRREVATKFLQPAPTRILRQLVEQGLISETQATLAEKVPIADDITVEADSGGHTDNRPLVCLLPSILALRDEFQTRYGYEQQVRVGAAGGIGTPQSALAAFMSGAAYVVTGSINQSCKEAGTSDYTKQLLSQAEMADVIMAPAADMFEMGVKLQVLKRGTLFPLRAQKLWELYRNYDSIEQIPIAEREKLEKQVFRKSIDAIWQETAAHVSQRNPEKVAKASHNPKLKMALIFRWYLGLSSRWGRSGEPGREVDYQIWCGPSMGSFNDWVRGSYLAEPSQRNVIDLAHHIMTGAAFFYRIQSLKIQGLYIPDSYSYYEPTPQA